MLASTVNVTSLHQMPVLAQIVEIKALKILVNTVHISLVTQITIKVQTKLDHIPEIRKPLIRLEIVVQINSMVQVVIGLVLK